MPHRFFIATLLLLYFTPPLLAHNDEPPIYIEVRDQATTLSVTLSKLGQTIDLDHNNDGQVTNSDIESVDNLINSWSTDLISFHNQSGRCVTSRASPLKKVRTQDAFIWLDIDLFIKCPDATTVSRATFAADNTSTDTLLIVSVGDNKHILKNGDSVLLENPTQRASKPVELGFVHILSGPDHLLFLLVVLIPIVRSRGEPTRLTTSLTHALVTTIVFAVTHSLTLVIAGLGLVQIPQQPIEALISATIVIGAVNTIWSNPKAVPLYLIALFGLIHGAGFANASSTIFVEALDFKTLGFFNLGIELGQLLFIVPLTALLHFVMRRWWADLLIQFVGVSSLLLACTWTVERLT